MLAGEINLLENILRVKVILCTFNGLFFLLGNFFMAKIALLLGL